MKNRSAFTLVEMLTVMAVIAILAGLILSTVGYAQKKGASSRAEAEIAALSAACESYKADNGIYPQNTATDALNANNLVNPFHNNPSAYPSASLHLYKSLSGDSDANRSRNAGETIYFPFKPNMLAPSSGTGTVTAINDPFGLSYGYSTAYKANLEKTTPANPSPGYNPTFDLWSTAGGTAKKSSETEDQYRLRWIKNW